MSTLHFWKMSGAGNDFIVIDGTRGLPHDVEDLARSLCPRRFSVGADGLLVVQDVQDDLVRVLYRNADGSHAGFCGNGARCVARFAREVIPELRARPSFSVAFDAVVVVARFPSDDVVEIELDAPKVIGGERRLPLGGPWGDVRVRLVEAGVLHLVVEDEASAPVPLEQVEQVLRIAWPEMVGRANITAEHIDANGVIHVRTLELGAGLTLACGSAALAMAPIHLAPGDVDWMTVMPPSGVALRVGLDRGRGRVKLSGEARCVFVAQSTVNRRL